MVKALTVLLAPPGVCHRVLDVLVDLSALDYLDGFVWLTADDALEDAIWVAQGRCHRTNLNDVLPAQGNLELVRLAVLVPLVRGQSQVDNTTYTRVQQEVGKKVRYLDPYTVAFANPDDFEPIPDWTRDSWQNLLIAPEERPGPAAEVPRAWTVKDGMIGLARQVAPTIAGLLGLWCGSGGPFDRQDPPTGGLRMVRTFHTVLDASIAEGALRSAVLTMDPYPVPQLDQGKVDPTRPQLAAERMSENLWNKYKNMLMSTPETEAPFKQTTTPWTQALRGYFSFLWQAIKGAPSRWAEGMIRSVKTSAAATLQRHLYGDGSAYKVVVGGIGPNGLPADWDETSNALAEIEVSASQQLGVSLAALSTPTDLGTLWESFVGGALSLADAGTRGEESVLQEGEYRYVVDQPDHIAPAEPFETTPALEAVHHIKSVDPADLLTADVLESRLSAMIEGGPYAQYASQFRDQLRSWRRQVATSYTGQVGKKLDEAITDCRRRVRDCLDKVQRLAQPLQFTIDDAKQRKLGRVVRIIGVVALVLMAASVASAWLGVVSWLVPAIVTPVILILALLVGFLNFYRRQSDIHQAIHRRQHDERQLGVVQRNLVRAISDLRRLTSAHSQYLQWSRLLGAFLRQPFGPPVVAAVASPGGIGGLTDMVRLGWLTLSPEQTMAVAARLREDFYPAGWMTPQFDRLLNSVGQHVEPDAAMAVAKDPARFMFSQSADDPMRSVLCRFTDAIVARGVPSQGADEFWAGVVSKALVHRTEGDGYMWGQISQRVTRIDRFGKTVQEDAATFDAALRPTDMSKQKMPLALLGVAQETEGTAYMVRGECRVESDRVGLGYSVTLVQWTDPMPVTQTQLVSASQDEGSYEFGEDELQ